MKLSDILYEKTADLWKEATEKAFVVEMADGTLDRSRFRYYMLQDYLYLQDYIDILQSTLDHTEDESLKAFLKQVIRETERETYRVHLPNMKKIGVGEDAIRNCRKMKAVTEYVAYMKRQLDEEGLYAGLTALLQCSWVYAYIGRTVTEKYAEAIAGSPYKSWFDAYTCPEYIEANQAWIDVLDRETAGISREETDKLCAIFRACAGYENRLWDALYIVDSSLARETWRGIRVSVS